MTNDLDYRLHWIYSVKARNRCWVTLTFSLLGFLITDRGSITRSYTDLLGFQNNYFLCSPVSLVKPQNGKYLWRTVKPKKFGWKSKNVLKSIINRKVAFFSE